MKILGLQKLSMVDYDGHIATTIFTSGCNFACPFCHNSSLVTKISQNEEIDTNDIFAHLKKRKGIIDAVVISGGEPTLQPDLIDFIKALKEYGVSIKLDTNGTKPEVIKKLIENNLIDYIAMDIKNSPQKYPTTAGRDVNLEAIKTSIDYIIKSNIDHEFRTTLVEEFHSTLDILEMSKKLKGAKKWRLQKFVDNDNCIMSGLHEVNKDKATEMLNIAKEYVPNTALRGY